MISNFILWSGKVTEEAIRVEYGEHSEDCMLPAKCAERARNRVIQTKHLKSNEVSCLPKLLVPRENQARVSDVWCNSA
eukprot:6379189-Amphidinium_carterae.4